jgi:tRNA-2-methylthio-N6-dimethylallyladenosine synthase
MLFEAGFSFTEKPEDADFILFNTCAVREHAEDRVFGNVGALKNIKRKHPSVLIALCGCMMEQEHVAKRIHDSFPFVGLVFGTNCLHEFPRLLYNNLLYGKRTFLRGNTDDNVYEGIPIKRDGTFKGFLPIMYGCDNFCSYCIVPYVRGREKSRAVCNRKTCILPHRPHRKSHPHRCDPRRTLRGISPGDGRGIPQAGECKPRGLQDRGRV